MSIQVQFSGIQWSVAELAAAMGASREYIESLPDAQASLAPDVADMQWNTPTWQEGWAVSKWFAEGVEPWGLDIRRYYATVRDLMLSGF